MPYDFFLSRYNQAYTCETAAFCESLVNKTEVPVPGSDGLIALMMALAADRSAAENRWVSMSEIVKTVTHCTSILQNQVGAALHSLGVTGSSVNEKEKKEL